MTTPSEGTDGKKSISALGTEGAFSLKFCIPLFMGSTLNPLNSSVIATALVPISDAVHVSVGHTVILITSLYLASAVAQPTAGKFSTEFGPRGVFLVGIVTVLLGGIVGGLASSLLALVISRVLIGVGTSAGYPSAMMIIHREAEQTGFAEPPGGVLGGLQIAATVTAAIGLPLGGVLVHIRGWRSAFFVNVPMTLLTLATAVLWVPRDGQLTGSKSVREIASRVDVVGIACLCSAMTLLLLFLFALPHTNVLQLVLSVILFVVLAWWELRVHRPFIDRSLTCALLLQIFHSLAPTSALDYQHYASTQFFMVLPSGWSWIEVSHPNLLAFFFRWGS